MNTTSSGKLFAIIIGAAITSAARAEVTIPPGFEIVQITDFNSGTNSGTDINNCGEIVFFSSSVGPRFQIMHYDNGILRQVTHDEHGGGFPKINDDGTMIWGRRLVDWGPVQMVRYQDGVLTVLAEDPEQMPAGKSINNLDHIVWTQSIDPPGACASFDLELMFHDGDTITQFTDEGFWNASPELNAQDDLAWAWANGCTVPFQVTLSLRAAGIVTDLTTLPGPSSATINDLGQVTWARSTGDGIVIWENGATTEVISNGWNPKINNRASIFYIRPQSGNWAAYILLDGVIHQLTDASTVNAFGSINDWDECAWEAGSSYSRIMHLRRIRTGDADFDGDVDLRKRV